MQIPSQTLFFQFISSAAISYDLMARWNHIKAFCRCTVYTLPISLKIQSPKNPKTTPPPPPKKQKMVGGVGRSQQENNLVCVTNLS